MDIVAVVGLAGSSAARVAEKLGQIVQAGRFDIRTATAPEELNGDATRVVFADDAPVGPGAGTAARSNLLAGVAAARTRGAALAILHDRKAADRWLEEVKREGLPEPPGPLRRIFVASGHSEVSERRVRTLADVLGLPLIQPDAPGDDHSGEGWGPRYAQIAQGERWLVHTPSWHAVEVLAPFADLVIHSETTSQEAGREFPAPNPEAKKWRLAFSPWLKRYPGVEARLLAKELAGHAHEAPVLRIRNPDEGEIVLAGFVAAASAAGGRGVSR
jgi:hypothetical protein